MLEQRSTVLTKNGLSILCIRVKYEFRSNEPALSGATLLNSARLDGWKYYINSDGYAGIQESEGQHVMGGLWILKDEHWGIFGLI